MKKCTLIGLVFFATVVVAGSAQAQSPVWFSTYHYDNLRTGWNSHETQLTLQNVTQSTFGIIGTAKLDDQVDAQPLIVPNQTLVGGTWRGTFDVVYVATESNSIYAIDASNGNILLFRNLGTPVAKGGIAHNGIQSTPVIDVATQTLYLIAYINSPRSYQLHALNLWDLTDKAGSPVTVAASHTLTNGSTFTFHATVQRQGPALLKANGIVYAGFGSFGDGNASIKRGWLLGWNAKTLLPLPGNRLADTVATSTSSFFLSSIWMSGFGIAASGNSLFFATGNSDCSIPKGVVCPKQTTYDGVNNIQESVVKLSGDLTTLRDIFTPSNVAAMDQADADLGSGGALLLPRQSGNFPFLAVAGGKDGRMFLLDRNNLGGFTPSGPDKAFDVQQAAGGCSCGRSYFTGSDNIGRVVSSAGSSVQTWHVQLSTWHDIVLEGTGTIASGQDAGFFTAVSTNGTQAYSGIIWAVGRPSTSTVITLSAFDATAVGGKLNLIFSAPAGSWTHTNGNANIVPVAANGLVYVASDKTLTIFGVVPAHAAAPQTAQTAVQPSPVASLASPHEITGTLLAISGSTLTLQTRTGKSAKIADSQAVQNEQVAPLFVGQPFTALGSSFDANGALVATSIVRAQGSSGELWPPDR